MLRPIEAMSDYARRGTAAEGAAGQGQQEAGRFSMKLRTIIAAAALSAAIAPAAAQAQVPDPISGGTQIGGLAPSYLELVLTQPAKATHATAIRSRIHQPAMNVPGWAPGGGVSCARAAVADMHGKAAAPAILHALALLVRFSIAVTPPPRQKRRGQRDVPGRSAGADS